MEVAFASLMVEPPAVRCIGVEMRPFSLGHYLILQHEQSPFISGDRFPLYADLVFAAFTCAHTWEENERLRRSPLARRLRAWLWGRLAGNFDVAGELLKLGRYIRESTEIPPQRPANPAHVKYLFSDWSTRLYKHLRSLNVPHSEAMNMPLCVANRLFVSHLEELGHASFYATRNDPQTEAMVRELEKLESGEITLPPQSFSA